MLTAERLREVLDYNPETGVFAWRVKTGKKVVVGRQAGCADPRGYIFIRIDRVLYTAHRLAWLHVHGEWPELEIDHRDGLSNAIDNLRVATSQQNKFNTRSREGSSSRFKGVSFDRATGRWVARIMVDGKSRNLGRFRSELEALAAYETEATRAHGAFHKRQEAA